VLYALRVSLCSPLGLHHAVHVDARRVYKVGVEAARRHELLHFCDGDAAGGGNGRVVVARRLPVDKVALRVALPRLDLRREQPRGRGLHRI